MQTCFNGEAEFGIWLKQKWIKFKSNLQRSVCEPNFNKFRGASSYFFLVLVNIFSLNPNKKGKRTPWNFLKLKNISDFFKRALRLMLIFCISYICCATLSLPISKDQNYSISGVPRDNASICKSGRGRKAVFSLQGWNDFYLQKLL